MEIEFVQKLEKYCSDFQSNNKSTIEIAEQSILQLMKTVQPYNLCFYLLGNSKDTMAHFYALLMIRDSSVREWSALEPSVKFNIVNTLFQYVENLHSMQWLNASAKNQSFNTLGVVCKRSWLDTDKFNGSTQHPNLTMELHQIIMEKVYLFIDCGIPDKIENGIRIIGSLIIEFSSSSKAAHIQLSWEFHQKCLISFQQLHLQPVFRKIMTLLDQFKSLIQQSGLSVLKDTKFLQILYITTKIFVDILDWRFLESGSSAMAYITSFSSARTNLKPTDDWASLFIINNSNNNDQSSNKQQCGPVVELLFQLHSLCESVEKIPNLLRHGMTQVCGLVGNMVKEINSKNNYLIGIICKLTPLIEKSITTRNWSEMEDVSNIIYRFCNTYKFNSLCGLPNELVLPFLQYTTQFVLSSLKLMAIWKKHGEEELEEEFENDCFDILLRAFVALISDADMIVSRKKHITLVNFNQQFTMLKQCAAQIYQSYIQSRLEISEIELTNGSNNDELEPKLSSSSLGGAEDEIDEDKKKYDEQLRSIAYIGRLNPGLSMDLLRDKINTTILMLLSNASNPSIDNSLPFETLHWLIIFAGHLIFDAENKVPSAIPNAIEDYTFQHSKEYPNQVDSVVELCNAVFRFHMEYENPLLQCGKAHSISPLVSQTSLWFTSGWCLVYLLPSSSLNVQISPKILDAFAKESNVLQITDYFVNKILLNLKCWSGDLDVLKATSVLLNSFTSNQSLCSYFTRSSSWLKLFYLEQGLDVGLTPSVYGQLYQAFAKVVFSFPLENRKEYFSHLVKSLIDQMDSVLGRSDFKTISQEAKIKENIYILLEKLNGIVTISESLFSSGGGDDGDCLFLTLDLFVKYAGSLIAMIPLYDHCNDIILLILRLFSNLTKNQLEILNEQRARTIFPYIIQLFNAVSSTSSHKKSLDSKEYYHRIRMMVKILFNILTYNDQSNNCPAIIAETAFHGISVITPCLSNNDLLLYPKLARNYFIIATYLFEAESIEVKNIPVINTLYSLIEAGILHHDLEIVKGCFECIVSLTVSVERLKEKSNGQVDLHYQSVIVQFIGSVINFLILSDFNVDELLASASETLFSLMYSCPEGYKSKVIELIVRQDPSIQSRVVAQFETLTINGKDRKSKDLFLKNLQTFLVNVKPLINKK